MVRRYRRSVDVCTAPWPELQQILDTTCANYDNERFAEVLYRWGFPVRPRFVQVWDY